MAEKIKVIAVNTLRWCEKYTKTDMVYLTKGGFWLSLGHIVAIIMGLISSIAFAHFFSKELFGNYKFILSITAIIGALSLTGMGSAVLRATARGVGDALKKGFHIKLKWSAGILLSGLALSIYYYVNGNTTLSYAFLLAGILLPISLSTSLYSSYLLGKKDFKRNSFYGIVHNFVPSLSIILSLIVTRNLLVVITAYFVSSALVSTFLYVRTSKIYQQKSIGTEEGLLFYSSHLSIMEVIGRIASYIDKILVFHFLGAAPLAIYAFATAPVEQLQSGKKILSMLIMPKFAERPFAELQKSGPRKALILTLYALILAGIWVLVAPHFYRILFPQYLDSVFLSQVYGFTLLAISGTIFNETLVAHKKTKELYVHRTAMPIIQIVLFMILLPMFGIMGLIVTHITVRFFSAILSYYLVRFPFKTASSN